MNTNRVTKEEWMAMFTEAGLDDATMDRWHQVFEKHHPQAHQAFLEWLSIEPEEIAGIRSDAGNC